MMKRTALHFLIVVIAGSFMAGPAAAVKPGQDVNPNGFPSGLHYNLNIIGKKDGFNCQVAYDEYGNPMYGNVVFIPENGEGQIYIQYGKGITELRVIDPCATFDAALVELPKMANGCRVYARALGKPTDDPRIKAFPELKSVQDEAGNDLIFLGSLLQDGFQTDDGFLYRTKGKSKALDITGMFTWSGSVCSLDVPFEDGLTPTSLCGKDTDGDGGADTDFHMPVDGACPVGYIRITAYCKTYTDTWLFNIAEFVQYLWSLENNGVKLLQIRFYPN
jgi:hypothetical protein